MTNVRTFIAVLLLVGCESNTLINEPLPPVDAGRPRRDASRPSTDDPDDEPGDEPTDDTDEPPSEDDGEQTPPDTDPEQDGGESPVESDAGTEPDPGDDTPPVMMESKIEGTALSAECSSYGLREGDVCAGYYCGVTLQDLTAEYKPGNKCDTTPERICDGGLTRTVGSCARSVKSNPLNALDSDEMIRAKVQDCVYEDPDNADLSEDCLSCFLDAAQCASDNCLTQCLTGDSATCDQCRLDNDCNQPVPTCAGFPTPF